MLPHWTKNDIVLGDGRFHYVRTGDGDKPPLVLLHGFSDNGLCWLPVARDLEAHYDIILPDARGHGLSARVRPGEPIDGAADVAGLIAALGLRRPVVGGHSMGGRAAAELGARFPTLVSALILEDPAWGDPPSIDEPLPDNPLRAWLDEIGALSVPELVALGRARNPTWPEIEWPAWAESKLQVDRNIQTIGTNRKPWRDYVAALAVPTLLLTADPTRGAIVTPAMAEEAASLTDVLQVAAVADAGHNIRRENYPAYMRAVRAFLDQLR
ncbi:MAG: alpha/beta hydrolase [Candidatus Promineofilum sp.]|uniref:alpha/beta fold hydrolase n=1 Tax=Promineifilum sp. TaxID=2664178 RepID=UPI002411A3C7|nr:alpha/beta hydrolase [Promineifilum sp.]MCO5180120.1 alpha/beta hydrolase [Promineifilum sp.]